MSKILITGATGQFGKASVEFLLKKGSSQNEISVLVRDENKASDLKEKGVTVVIGDYNDYHSLLNAFHGIDTLLFVSSNDMVKRIAQHKNVVNAAKETGVKHVIYTSAMHDSKVEKSAIAFVHDVHLKTEKWLKESGLSYTFLRNVLYMDLIPFYIGDKVLETNTIYFPAGNGKAAVALRSDIAEAAANILTTGGHSGRSYNIANVEAYSYQDVAAIISEITGKTINYYSPTPEEYSKTLVKAGVPSEYIGFLAGFALAQARGEFDVTSNDLEKLLGRKPTTLKTYLKTIYKS